MDNKEVKFYKNGVTVHDNKTGFTRMYIKNEEGKVIAKLKYAHTPESLLIAQDFWLYFEKRVSQECDISKLDARESWANNIETEKKEM